MDKFGIIRKHRNPKIGPAPPKTGGFAKLPFGFPSRGPLDSLTGLRDWEVRDSFGPKSVSRRFAGQVSGLRAVMTQ